MSGRYLLGRLARGSVAQVSRQAAYIQLSRSKLIETPEREGRPVSVELRLGPNAADGTERVNLQGSIPTVPPIS